MNIYVGNNFTEIKINDYNVEFSDELLQYLYNNRNKIKIDLDILFKIDPYSDTILEYKNVEKIYNICVLLIKSDVLREFYDYSEAIDTLNNFEYISKLALLNKKGLVFIGD